MTWPSRGGNPKRFVKVRGKDSGFRLRNGVCGISVDSYDVWVAPSVIYRAIEVILVELCVDIVRMLMVLMPKK